MFKIKITEQKVKVGKIFINYAISKVEGSNPDKTLIILPGVFGSLTQFNVYLNKIPMSLKNYQIIAWDPPGYGKSIPPERNICVEMNENDAEYLNDFTKALNLNSFSLFGHTNGGISALFFGAKYPQKVEKLIITSPDIPLSPEAAKFTIAMSDLSTWPKQNLDELTKIYKVEYIEKMLKDIAKILDEVIEKYSEDYMAEVLKKIEAKTLILHSERDFLTPKTLIDFLVRNIKNSSSICFRNGGHNFHRTLADEVIEIVGKFLELKGKI